MKGFKISDYSNWFKSFVGRHHVSVPGWKLCLISKHCLRAEAWKSLTKTQRRAWFKGILKAHKENREFYRDVMGGN